MKSVQPVGDYMCRYVSICVYMCVCISQQLSSLLNSYVARYGRKFCGGLRGNIYASLPDITP